jgi:DNA processing protein
VVVSGLARGIDAMAHEAALATGTTAVLAGGLDVVYPPEHEVLQRTIGERGSLVTEMPFGFTPRGRDFPRRNRIISGISLGVLIVEAARRSGSLITARLAAEQGRDVFAVPGHPLDPRADGTNKLLKSGATLVTEAADVLSALAPLTRAPVAQSLRDEAPGRVAVAPADAGRPVSLSQRERDRVIAALGPAPVDVDTLMRGTGLPIQAVQVALIELALAGRIERHGHGLVSLLPEAGTAT